MNICRSDHWSSALRMNIKFCFIKLGGKYMDINMLFKIAAIGILVAVMNQVLVRAGRDDQAMMTTLAGLVIVLTMVIKEISTLFTTVKTIFNL